MVFSFEIDGVHICHLGDLGHLLSDEQLSELGPIACRGWARSMVRFSGAYLPPFAREPIEIVVWHRKKTLPPVAFKDGHAISVPMPIRNLLILSASSWGAGHLRAAQAVELAARELVPDANIRNIDVLTLTNAPFRHLYGKAYLDLVNKARTCWGIIYDLTDRPASGPRNRLNCIWCRR